MTRADRLDAPEAPILDDGVVRLRRIRVDDAAAHLAGEDVEMQRWLSGGRSTIATVTRFLRECESAWTAGGDCRAFGITDAVSGELAGLLEVLIRQPFLDDRQANLAYGVYPTWRGCGFATRAVELGCRYLASGMARQAIIRVQPANHRSATVARRAGFTFVGHRTNASVPLDWYARDLTQDGPVGKIA